MNKKTIYRNLPSEKLLFFLKKDLLLNDQAVDLAIKHSNLESAPLPIVLWSFGLLDLNQYHCLNTNQLFCQQLKSYLLFFQNYFQFFFYYDVQKKYYSHHHFLFSNN